MSSDRDQKPLTIHRLREAEGFARKLLNDIALKRAAIERGRKRATWEDLADAGFLRDDLREIARYSRVIDSEEYGPAKTKVYPTTNSRGRTVAVTIPED